MRACLNFLAVICLVYFVLFFRFVVAQKVFFFCRLLLLLFFWMRFCVLCFVSVACVAQTMTRIAALSASASTPMGVAIAAIDTAGRRRRQRRNRYQKPTINAMRIEHRRERKSEVIVREGERGRKSCVSWALVARTRWTVDRFQPLVLWLIKYVNIFIYDLLIANRQKSCQYANQTIAGNNRNSNSNSNDNININNEQLVHTQQADNKARNSTATHTHTHTQFRNVYVCMYLCLIDTAHLCLAHSLLISNNKYEKSAQ